MAIGFEDGAPVPTRVHEGPEPTIFVSGGEDGCSVVVVGEERPCLGKVTGQAEDLRHPPEPLTPLAVGLHGVGVGDGRILPQAARIDVGVAVEMGAHLLDYPDLLVVSHDMT